MGFHCMNCQTDLPGVDKLKAEVARLEGELAAETAMCDQVIHAFVAQKEALRKWDGWLRYASKGFEMDESFKIIIEKALAGEEPPEVG